MRRHLAGSPDRGSWVYRQIFVRELHEDRLGPGTVLVNPRDQLLPIPGMEIELLRPRTRSCRQGARSRPALWPRALRLFSPGALADQLLDLAQLSLLIRRSGLVYQLNKPPTPEENQ